MELKKVKTVVVLQARSTSKRFPNKILKRVRGQTLIQVLIKRLKFCKKVDAIVVAIPKNKKQKKLKSHLKNIERISLKVVNKMFLIGFIRRLKNLNQKTLLE